MRRDSNDKDWQEVKRKVRIRDGEVCRLLRVCTMVEGATLMKKAGSMVHKLDPAHYIAVSHDPTIMYDENNIVMLNHYSHTLLDSYKDPINGKPISREEVQEWWERILRGNRKQYDYLKEKGLVENA